MEIIAAQPPLKNILQFQASDIKNAKQQAIPPKTEDVTKWATKTWYPWATQRAISDERTVVNIMHLSSVKIDEVTEKQLNYWIPRFILEVRKKNSEPYQPNSLYQMICGLQK